MNQGLVAEQLSGVPYKKGDFIGQKYEVYGILGMGGFGIVYLVYSHEGKSIYALKTFRDEYLSDAETRERFHTEAGIWVALERHPYLVQAHFVEEFSGRLYIGMEFVAPDERGLNSIEGYLKRKPPDLIQSLKWSIQFCHGMEYAYSKGIRCHRDIKPDNIMISQDSMVKISDFGLAGVIGTSKAMSDIKIDIQKDKVGLSCQSMEGNGVGTPTHMPPEQFSNITECDERSDIYSFGIVLYQMATGSKFPFLAPLPKDKSKEEMMRFWRAMYRLHSETPAPNLSSPLSSLVKRCLEKKPAKRYQSFRYLKEELECILKCQTGETIKPPEIDEEFEAWEWGNKGVSLAMLGRLEEAICCYDNVIQLAPRNAKSWNNKGLSLFKLGHVNEAIHCFDKAIELDPSYKLAWNNKSNPLAHQGKFEEAIHCIDKAIELDPNFVMFLNSKGAILEKLGHYNEAIPFFDKAIKLDPKDAKAWYNKGVCLDKLDRFEEAIHYYNKAIEIDPMYVSAWYNKGYLLNDLASFEEAIRCFDKAIELDPMETSYWCGKGKSLYELKRFENAIYCYDKAIELDPKDAKTWYNKGRVLSDLSCFNDAIGCYNKAIELDSMLDSAWYNKGTSLGRLNRFDEAIFCYDKAIKINSMDIKVWYNKGTSLLHLSRFNEAIHCFDKAIELDPSYKLAWFNKGNSLYKLNLFNKAISCIDKVIKLDPSYVSAWFNKGTLFYNLNRFDEAICCLDKATEIDPTYALAWYNKGLAEDKINCRQDAIHSFKRFIDLALATQYAKQTQYVQQRLMELEEK